MSDGEYHAYIGLLVLSGLILSVLAARGFGQDRLYRVIDGVFAAGFLLYAAYLLLADPVEVTIVFYAFVVPVLAIVQAGRAYRDSRKGRPIKGTDNPEPRKSRFKFPKRYGSTPPPPDPPSPGHPGSSAASSSLGPVPSPGDNPFAAAPDASPPPAAEPYRAAPSGLPAPTAPTPDTGAPTGPGWHGVTSTEPPSTGDRPPAAHPGATPSGLPGAPEPTAWRAGPEDGPPTGYRRVEPAPPGNGRQPEPGYARPPSPGADTEGPYRPSHAEGRNPPADPEHVGRHRARDTESDQEPGPWPPHSAPRG